MQIELQRLGFIRLLVQGQVVRLDAELPPFPDHAPIEVLVDRIAVRSDRRARVLDSLEQALRFGQGLVHVHGPQGQVQKFSQHFALSGVRPHLSRPYPESVFF